MLASNLEHGHDNIMQTELPSHADTIFGTVGGLCKKQRSHDLLGTYAITKRRRAIMPNQGEPVVYCLLVDKTYPNNFFPIEKKEKNIGQDFRITPYIHYAYSSLKIDNVRG